MSNIIRIPLKVHHLNPLSGYATEGLSLAAIQGFFQCLDLQDWRSEFRTIRGSYKEQYESKLNEQLETVSEIRNFIRINVKEPRHSPEVGTQTSS